MIIQWALVIGLLFFLFYALLRRTKSRFINVAIAMTSIAGIYFVLLPEQTNDIARWMGVGRGADLILYCWLVISLIISATLQFKIMALEEMLTDLTRELALRAPREPPARDLRPARTK